MSNDPILNSFEVTQPEGDGGKRLEITEDVRQAFQTAMDVPSTTDLTAAAVPQVQPQVILGNPGSTPARATSVGLAGGISIDGDGNLKAGGGEAWRLLDLYFAARNDDKDGSGTYLDPWDVSTPAKFDLRMTELYVSGDAANLYFAAGHYYINPIRPLEVHPVVNGVYADWYWGNAWFLHGEGVGRTVFHFAADSNLADDATGARILLRSSRKSNDAGFASVGCIKNITIDGGVTSFSSLLGPSTTYRFAFDLDVGVFAVENVEFIRLGGRGQEMFYFIIGNGLAAADSAAPPRQAITVTGCKSDELHHDGYSGGGFLVRSLNPGHHQRLLAYNNTFKDAYWCAKDYWHIDHDLETIDSGRSNYGCYNYDTGSCHHLSFTRLTCTNGGSTQNLAGCITIGNKDPGLDTTANNWKHITIDDCYFQGREGSSMVCPAVFIAGGGVDDLKIGKNRIKKVTGQPAYGVIFYDTLLTDTIYYPGYGVPDVYPAPGTVVPNGAIREYWGNTVVDDGTVPALLQNTSVGDARIAGVSIAKLARPDVVNYSGAVVTLQASDLGKHVRLTHFANSTVVVPLDLTAGASSNKLELFNVSNAPRTLVAGSGVTFNAPDNGLIINKKLTAHLTEITPNEWDVAVGGPLSAPAAVPVIVTPPTVSGYRVVGQTLTATQTVWQAPPTSVTHQWYRGQTPISGATGLTYVLVEADAGSLISVVDIGTNSYGSTYSGSVETEVVDLGVWLDSVGGNDARTGIGPSQSVRTPTRLMAIVGSDASDLNISVVTDSVFPDQLTLAGDNITVLAAGSGAKPKFDCADAITAFTKTAGRTNVYQASITLPGNTKIEGNVWADGVCLQQVTSLSACDTTPARAYISDWTATSTILYVHAPASAVPITGDGKVYKFSRRQFGLLLTGNNIKVVGIHGANNAHQDGSIKFIGTGANPKNCRFSGGCRHYLFVQAGADVDGCTFDSDGGNWLEAPFGFNAVVMNQGNISGETWTVRNTVFGDEAGTGVPSIGLTGPLQHGSTEGELLSVANYTDCTFRRMAAMGALAAAQTNVLRPVYDRNYGGFGWSDPGNNLLLSYGTGTTNQFVSVSAGGGVISRNNVITLPLLGATTSSVGAYRYDSGATDLSITLEDDVYTVVDGNVGTNNKLIHSARGPVIIRRTSILPIMCSMMDFVFDAGFTVGSSTYVGENNVWPIGAQFKLNTTVYSTLADLQTAGYDASSTTAPLPSVVASDSFNRANENLDVSTGWTFVSGTAATMGVVSNALNSIVATAVNSYYRRQVMASADHWVKFKLAAVPASSSPYVALRAIDENNGLIFKVTTSAYQLSTLVATTATLKINSSVIAPAVGDTIIIAVKGTKAWCYVIRAGLGLSAARQIGKAIELSAPTLAAATGVGVIRRSGAATAFIDDFECGLVP